MSKSSRPIVARAAKSVSVIGSRLWSEALESRTLLTAIASDQTLTGTIATPTATADYTITAAVGNSIMAVVGETATSPFDPAIAIIRPDGTTLTSASSELGTLLYADAVTQAGTWTIRVSDGGSNDTGAFRLTVGLFPGTQAPSDGNGGAITSGQRKDGAIDLGDLDVYTVAINAGDSPIATTARLDGDVNFQPGLDVYGPTGAHLASNGGNIGTELPFTAATTGTYYVVVSDNVNYNANDDNLGAGSYRLRLVKLPATQSQDDPDGGAITSGGRVDGTIDLGDLDVYTTTLSAGDSAIATVAERNGDLAFNPRLRIYGPTGALVSNADRSSTLGTELSFVASAAGTYSFVVSDDVNYNLADYGMAAGDYTFRFVKAPGTQLQDDADGGAITSGQRHDGSIELGDLDVYTASVTAGDNVIATVAERNGNLAFDPRMRIYGPTGALVTNADDSSTLGTELDFAATVSGTYYFVVSDAVNYNFGDDGMAAGDYSFRLVKAPGSQSQDDLDGGGITSGQKRNATIDLGDIDVWQVSASAGDTLITSAVERRGDHPFDPRLRIFGPTGSKLFDNSSTLGSLDSLTAASSGTYYIVITDQVNYNAADNAMAAGDYTLRMVKPPASTTNDDADGGPITSGERRLGTLDRGDLDVYTFTASAGTALLVNAGKITADSYQPYVAVYGPTGALVAQNDPNTNFVAAKFSLASSGTYYAVVSEGVNYNSSSNDIQTGDYALSIALSPATQTTDTDSGTLISGQSRAGSISVGDIDIYTFAVTAGTSFTVNLLDTASTAFTPDLIVVGPTGTVLYSDYDATSRSYTLANPAASGTYTAFVLDAGGQQEGSYSIALNAAAGADTFAPTVLTADYRYNDPLPDLRVAFSEPVGASFSIDDIHLLDRTTNTTVDPFALTVTFDSTRNYLVATFDGLDNRVLPDGNYRLHINKADITDAVGNGLATDLNYDFFVLAGDANRDRVVNFADLVILAQNYGGVDRTFSEGNFNYATDGAVGFSDLVILAQKYNQSLPALPAVVASRTGGTNAGRAIGGGGGDSGAIDGIVGRPKDDALSSL